MYATAARHHIDVVSTLVYAHPQNQDDADEYRRVVEAEGGRVALLVDELLGQQQVVVKNLEANYRKVDDVSGATIMGDGRVALILDVLGFAHHSKIISDSLDHTTVSDKHASKDAAARQALLLFRSGDGERMAIPLSIVARLEEFARSSLERAGQHDVVQYRNRIMPLLRLSDAVPGCTRSAAEEGQDPIQVVVYSDGTRSVGLVVDEIEDIVEESFSLQAENGRRGVLGDGLVGGAAECGHRQRRLQVGVTRLRRDDNGVRATDRAGIGCQRQPVRIKARTGRCTRWCRDGAGELVRRRPALGTGREIPVHGLVVDLREQVVQAVVGIRIVDRRDVPG